MYSSESCLFFSVQILTFCLPITVYLTLSVWGPGIMRMSGSIITLQDVTMTGSYNQCPDKGLTVWSGFLLLHSISGQVVFELYYLLYYAISLKGSILSDSAWSPAYDCCMFSPEMLKGEFLMDAMFVSSTLSLLSALYHYYFFFHVLLFFDRLI